MQLSYRQAPVRSGTRIFPRTSVACSPHYRATTSVTARRGAGGWKVSCSAVPASGDTQTTAGSPPSGPGKSKQTGGAGDPEGRGEAQGWLPDAIQLARLVVIVGGALAALNTFMSTATGILTWYGSLPTKADLTATEGHMKDSFRDVKDSLKTVVTWPYLIGGVGLFAMGRWGK